MTYDFNYAFLHKVFIDVLPHKRDDTGKLQDYYTLAAVLQCCITNVADELKSKDAMNDFLDHPVIGLFEDAVKQTFPKSVDKTPTNSPTSTRSAQSTPKAKKQRVR